MPAPKGNQNAKGNRGGPGQPALYRPRFAEQAKKACEAGFTDVELGELFGVSEVTINNWKLLHVEFGLALKLGKDIPNTRVNRSLYMRACGFWVDSEKVFCSDGEVTRVPIREYYPPDTTACIWWQKNREPDLWRDKHDVTVNGTVNINQTVRDLTQLSEDEIQREYAEALGEAAQMQSVSSRTAH